MLELYFNQRRCRFLPSPPHAPAPVRVRSSRPPDHAGRCAPPDKSAGLQTHPQCKRVHLSAKWHALLVSHVHAAQCERVPLACCSPPTSPWRAALHLNLGSPQCGRGERLCGDACRSPHMERGGPRKFTMHRLSLPMAGCTGCFAARTLFVCPTNRVLTVWLACTCAHWCRAVLVRAD